MRAQLPEEELQALWQAGRGLTAARAIAEAEERLPTARPRAIAHRSMGPIARSLAAEIPDGARTIRAPSGFMLTAFSPRLCPPVDSLSAPEGYAVLIGNNTLSTEDHL